MTASDRYVRQETERGRFGALTEIAGWLDDPNVAEVVDEELAQAGDLVWISIARKGVEYHALGDAGFTRCRRSTRTGEVLLRVDAIEHYGSKPCPRC